MSRTRGYRMTYILACTYTRWYIHTYIHVHTGIPVPMIHVCMYVRTDTCRPLAVRWYPVVLPFHSLDTYFVLLFRTLRAELALCPSRATRYPINIHSDLGFKNHSS